MLAVLLIEGEKLLDHRKGNAGLKYFIFMVDLVLTVCINALVNIYSMAVLKVKQRP